jgi:hypothetical protein
VLTELTDLIAREFPTKANILPEKVIETEPEDGAFDKVILDKSIWENVKTDEVEDCCIWAEAYTAMFTPEPEANLHDNKESEFQMDLEQLEK